MRNGHKIITTPWTAVLEGYNADASGPLSCIGRGPTEVAAVADLIEQISKLYEVERPKP